MDTENSPNAGQSGHSEAPREVWLVHGREKAGRRQKEGWTSPGFSAPKRRDYGLPPVTEMWSERGRCNAKESKKDKDKGNPDHNGI